MGSGRYQKGKENEGADGPRGSKATMMRVSSQRIKCVWEEESDMRLG